MAFGSVVYLIDVEMVLIGCQSEEMHELSRHTHRERESVEELSRRRERAKIMRWAWQNVVRQL